MTVESDRPRVLLVDDERDIVDGIALHLRGKAEVETATSAQAAIAALERAPAFAVLVTDLRMPGMDGLELLGVALEHWPDTTRILLTGQGDMRSAAEAINAGRIFRFLLKPCPPRDLIAAVTAAAEQHRLVTAERVLLQKTLLGSVKALTDVLALANPMAFGRAERIRRRARDIATRMDMKDTWRVEIAAMLTEVGVVTLPPTTIDKLYYGIELDDHEARMVRRIPEIVEKLLGPIPRLEEVRAIIRTQRFRFDGSDGAAGRELPLEARVLRVATDLDALEAREEPPADPIAVLRARSGEYDPAVLDALDVGAEPARPTTTVTLDRLAVGMRLARDVRTPADILLVPRGFQVDVTLLERLRNLPPGAIRGPIDVYAD